MSYLGHIDEATRFHVAGWVADRDDLQMSLCVDILIDGEPQGWVRASEYREGLTTLGPEASGCYAFRYYFADPISMFKRHELTVRVSNTNFFLANSGHHMEPVMSDDAFGVHRPGGPILLSTSGRTGSTAVMAALAQHPNIVVAGGRPYEVEMGCYYAYALRTLAARGDLTRSLNTDRITASENRFQIGFNPYFDHSFSSVFTDTTTLARFLSERVPVRLARALRDIILDYYQEIAADKGNAHPIYFAEKSLPERDSRLGIRYMFPNVREILLVRDLRDILSSSIATKHADFEVILADTVSTAKQFIAILNENRAGIMTLKYEDFVKQGEAAVARIYDFLGLVAVRPADDEMTALFEVHATSSSPSASIGRWRRDLSSEQRSQCKVLDPYLEQLGYEV